MSRLHNYCCAATGNTTTIIRCHTGGARLVDLVNVRDLDTLRVPLAEPPPVTTAPTLLDLDTVRVLEPLPPCDGSAPTLLVLDTVRVREPLSTDDGRATTLLVLDTVRVREPLSTDDGRAPTLLVLDTVRVREPLPPDDGRAPTLAVLDTVRVRELLPWEAAAPGLGLMLGVPPTTPPADRLRDGVAPPPPLAARLWERVGVPPGPKDGEALGRTPGPNSHTGQTQTMLGASTAAGESTVTTLTATGRGEQRDPNLSRGVKGSWRQWQSETWCGTLMGWWTGSLSQWASEWGSWTWA
jgi:hypothetical protein